MSMTSAKASWINRRHAAYREASKPLASYPGISTEAKFQAKLESITEASKPVPNAPDYSATDARAESLAIRFAAYIPAWNQPANVPDLRHLLPKLA